MSNPEKYRLHAASCLQLARQTRDMTEKAVLLEMARVWYNLVDQAERNSKADVFYETPPHRAGK